MPDKLPLMIVITKVQSAPQVFAVFQGDISPDLLMAQLIDAVENYNQTRSIEKAAVSDGTFTSPCRRISVTLTEVTPAGMATLVVAKPPVVLTVTVAVNVVVGGINTEQLSVGVGNV